MYFEQNINCFHLKIIVLKSLNNRCIFHRLVCVCVATSKLTLYIIENMFKSSIFFFRLALLNEYCNITLLFFFPLNL